MSEETYLGNGLYVSVINGMIILRASREDGDHLVGLEWESYQALTTFVDNLERKENEQL